MAVRRPNPAAAPHVIDMFVAMWECGIIGSIVELDLLIVHSSYTVLIIVCTIGCYHEIIYRARALSTQKQDLLSVQIQLIIEVFVALRPIAALAVTLPTLNICLPASI